MSGNAFVIQLVTDVLDSGHTPEEVCSQHPELLEEVRRRVQRCQELNSRLDQIFSSHSPGGDRDFAFNARLPQIPLYQVHALIGEGGMGVVYSAEHLKLKRLVALKMLRSGACASPAELSRFSLEAEAIAGLQHPNIVQVHDLGEIEGRPYFTMEYLDGGSLAQKLNGDPLQPAEAARYLVTMATAVGAAHRAGIVHRDLKPGNVLFNSDGLLKISDFGLARRMAEEDGLTFGGGRIGTPSYMAPEQASGMTAVIGPRADIYALGAILYEMLTGRPPFRGASAADTERQVINDDPATPRRLNTSVPRDLETICLKCLHKDPSRRYLNAADLAADADRYLRGEPIQARPVGAIERAIKWTRRRPAQTIAVAASFLLTVVLGGGALWFLSARSARAQAVKTDLKLVDALERQGKWDDAHTMLLRASVELGGHGPDDLHSLIAQDKRDLDLVSRLDGIKLDHADAAGNRIRFRRGDSYKSAFDDAGIAMFAGDEASVATQIKKSPIRVALKAAIDDWIISNYDLPQRQRLLRIALASDENPSDWLREARNPNICFDKDALTKLLATAPIEDEPVSLLVELGTQLTALKGDSVPFLLKLQQRYPRDFWANLALGYAEWDANNNTDALRFFQAAVVVRPNAAIAENNLSKLLASTDRDEEALIHGRNAVNLDPSVAACHVNLGIALSKTHHSEESLKEFRLAVRLAPNEPATHVMLGQCLELLGRKGEAMEEYRLTLMLDPTDPIARSRGGSAMLAHAALEQRWASWKASLEADPPDHVKWNGYLELCLYLRHEDEYRRARTRLLAIFGNTTDAYVAERTGRACLLLPASEQETQKAIVLIDRALSADKSTIAPGAPYNFRVAKALADFRTGDLQSAIQILRATPTWVLKPMPPLMLAMIEQQQGENNEARKTFDAAMKRFDWSEDRATDADAWMFHVIRREAEQMIEPTSQSATRP